MCLRAVVLVLFALAYVPAAHAVDFTTCGQIIRHGALALDFVTVR
jgi:hypothetical protein